MSKHWAQILGTTEETAQNMINKLEELAAFPAEDNRLLSELKTKLRIKVSELGLDPDDTTPKELYHSLISHFDNDSWQFDKIIGGSIPALVRLIEITEFPDEAWLLKRSVAKELLRSHPPRRLPKALHYRSVDSMLKRRDVDEIYALLPFTESSVWHKSFVRKHYQLKPSDYELRKVEVISMPAKDLAVHPRAAVSFVPNVGVVAIWPDTAVRLSAWTAVYIAVLAAIEEIRITQFVLMTKQVRPNFGREVASTLEQGLSGAAELEGYKLGWHSIYSHYGQLPHSSNLLLQEAYALDNKAQKINAIQSLANFHPIFRWWHGCEDVCAFVSRGVISFNIGDLATSIAYGGQYHRRSSDYIKNTLTSELLSRYMKHQGVENHILDQIEGHVDDFARWVPSKVKLALSGEFQEARST